MNFQEVLTDQLKKQGATVFVMSLAIWFFYVQFNDLRTEVKDCNDMRMQEYRADHQEMRSVINANTRAIESLIEK